MTASGTSHFRFEALNPNHNRADFHCGEPALDGYLQRLARQDVARNLTRAYVLTRDGKAVDGFYTLSATSIDPGGLPPELGRKLPHLGVPATLLGRMAVDQRVQGLNLGNAVLMNAIQKAWEGSRVIGSWAVVVDAKQGARDFYLRRDFQALPEHPSRLFLTLDHFAKSMSGLTIAE